MARTAQLGLPLVAPAQAQKHVTINEALTRLDAAMQLRVASAVTFTPPAATTDGTAYIVPTAATDDWAGQASRVAVWSNGGWLLLDPKPGWRAWDEGLSRNLTFDGKTWIANAVAISPNGATTFMRVVEIDHVVTAGVTNVVAGAIPSGAMVFGVTGRVIEGVQGSGLVAWRLGVTGSDNRYGSGLGLGANSALSGLSGSPVTYYAETPLLLTGEGGAFASGKIRLGVHILELGVPRSV